MLLVLNAENPSKAIAYVRVSSQRQVDEGVSIDAQIKRIREYARYKGMDIDDKDIIIEEGVSGGVPIWERPGGRHLKTRLKTGAYPHILTMRLDRMFRLVTDALVTVDELADSGISLHVVDMDGEAIDTSTSMGSVRQDPLLALRLPLNFAMGIRTHPLKLSENDYAGEWFNPAQVQE